MIFVDKLRSCLRNKNWPYDKSCHLFADSIEELKIFAVVIGLKKSWFQDNKRLPHFDLTEGMRVRAVNGGAIEMPNKEFFNRLKGDKFIMKNKKEKSVWMNERMAKGYSFIYFKGIVNNEKINVGVECVETGEQFDFQWISE